ncbi:winged helix-turn-helix domain-containing protein [Alteromonas ponticola]|uniref:Winged helix-turn-helix domain-containing protein n=1 Tax=Alteromonas aquimaris TaxID=2998417 RepID=A0ABT3PB33_9ALTE|nr:winged helix-turn-helix domain-containing protein [Alteromonas aquimaris]MCW8109924.1 winged helix-turn-helix domain-containing protein [Alteromonas aquimaris]
MQVVRSTDWYFCIKNQELIYLDGNVVVLQTRLARCLEALILNAGETISYDELLLKVWKTEHRDSSTISSVIAELRKLINCRKKGPTYIKTVPKKGYCFVGSVEILELSPQEISALKNLNKPTTSQETFSLPNPGETRTVSPTIISEPAAEGYIESTGSEEDSYPSSSSWKRNWWAAGLVLLTFSIIAVYWMSETKPPNSSKESMYDSLHIYTYEPGLELEFDVSQSGDWLVYAHQTSLSTPKTIILKNLTTNKAYYYDSIDNESVYSPSFSPDAKKIVFIKSTAEACQVRTIEINENGFLPETDTYISSCGLSRIWTTTAFTADGKNIFFSRSTSLADPLKIIKLNLETGFERQITSPATSGRGDYSFSLSPDGEKLAIVRNHLWKSSNIMVLELDSEEINHVQSLPYLILGVGWMDDNTLLYVNFDKRMVAYNIEDSKEAFPITNERHLHFPIMREGRLYATRGEILDSTIWRFPLSNELGIKPEPFIDTPYKDQAPVATENGVYFISNRTGKNQIWLQSNRGLSQVSKFEESGLIEEIVYASELNQLLGLFNHRLFSINLESNKFTFLSKNVESIKNFSLSSDGYSVLYAVEQDEIWSIYRFDIRTGKHQYLFRGFSVKSVGNELYFSKLRETGLWKYDLTNNTEELVLENKNFKAAQYWHISQNFLIYLVDRTIHYLSISDMNEVWRINLDNRSKNLSCSNEKNQCFFEQSSSGNTEIIELKKTKEF